MRSADGGLTVMPTDDRCTPKLGIRVAVCQSLCLPGDLQGNLHRVERAVSEAAGIGAQIACFPETALLAWVNPDAHRRATPIPGAWSDGLCDLAREAGVMLSIGLAEKHGAKLYDSAILISAEGEILLKHRKVNTLVHLLSPPYGRGTLEEIAVVATELGTIGMLICADTFVGEVVQRMADLEPDLLIVPYGWAAEAHKWPEHGEELRKLVVATARTVGCPVVGTDCVGMIAHGPWTGQTFGGHSVVADAEGKGVLVAKDREPDMMVVEI